MGFILFDSIIVFVILAYGIVAIINKRKFIVNSEVIQGIIKDVIYDGAYYYPIIEYADRGNPNIKHTYELKSCNANCSYEVGEIVEMLYYSDGVKTKILINSWLQRWGFTVMLVIVSIIIVIIV